MLILTGVLALAAGEARADLSKPNASPRPLVKRTSGTATPARWAASLDLVGSLAPGLVETGPAFDGAEVRELPAAPDSHQLVLSAFACLGVWRVLRTATHWQLGALPDWYHAEGPTQVGHAFAYDFEFFAAPLCFVDDLNAGQRASFRIRPTIRIGPPTQQHASVVDTRGPPRAS